MHVPMQQEHLRPWTPEPEAGSPAEETVETELVAETIDGGLVRLSMLGGTCARGELVPCFTPSGCKGISACTADGRGYTDCVCDQAAGAVQLGR
jgi:hypothetical protein